MNEIETENVYEITQHDDELVYTISNITEDLTLSVLFVADTWWEHLEYFEFIGKGTKDEPYIIATINDLALISYLLNNNIEHKEGNISYHYAYYLVISDIDCGEEYFFVPIGTRNNPFNGTFDYAYHGIENIKTERDVAYYQYDGLFDVIGDMGQVINRYRRYDILVLSILGSLVFLFVVIRIVFAVEKRRNKPKKIVTLDNYKKN